MPRYQYECQTCEQSFERKQSFADDPLTDCPLCGTEDTVTRVITPVGVIFKGSGFYINDSKNKNKNKNKDSSKSKDAKSKDAKSKTDSENKKTSTSEKTETKKPEAKEKSK